MWDQLDATISDFIGNQLFLNMLDKQPTPHSAHSLPADSPTSQQLQQYRKR